MDIPYVLEGGQDVIECKRSKGAFIFYMLHLNWTLGEVDGYGLRKSDFGSEFVTYNKILGWDRQ